MRAAASSPCIFLPLFFCLVVGFAIVVHGHSEQDQETPEDVSYVTCGSLIKLKHVPTGYRLHSPEVNYGSSGSGQQAVTTIQDPADTDSFWLVRGRNGHACKQGTPIKQGMAFTLEHASSGRMLHSHLHLSPLSRQKEVSCFDGNDSGDNWILQNEGGKWRRDQVVRIKHADVGCYLSSSRRYKYQRAITGQLEVSCDDQPTDDTQWVVEEGIYFEVRA